MKKIEDLFQHYLKLTGNPLAASNLVLAEVHCLNDSPPDQIAATMLTVAESASVLRVSERTIYGLCSSGKLRHTRIGAGRGTIRIRRYDLDSYESIETVSGGIFERMRKR